MTEPLLAAKMGPEILTDRLILRPWRPSDRAPFATLNADPDVMRFFPSTLSREQSDAMADRIEAAFKERGFGWWAIEIPGRTAFAGFVGLSVPPFETAFTPCVETGWRLAKAHWGQGYAIEGARAVVAFGFERLGLEEIVAFAVPANTASLRVMEKLGMSRDEAGDFDHPLVAVGHPLRRHALYRLRRAP